MKITIIGAGHIGSAIATCLAQGYIFNEKDITITNQSPDKFDLLTQRFPAIHTSTDNKQATADADIIVLAVNASNVDNVLSSLRFSSEQILVSVVAGIDIIHLARLVKREIPIFRAIPNMAISERSSLTLISSRGATEEQKELISRIFEEGGKCMFLDEQKLDVASTFTSSGVAFALKYVQAAMQAGIELGISPQDAMLMAAYGLEGATELLLNHPTHPCIEIDSITTPGGVTIKGINELDKGGFVSSIINAIKVCATTKNSEE